MCGHWLWLKVGTGAPTARNMTARGKREAKRSASPLVTDNQNVPALKGRDSRCLFRPFRPRYRLVCVNPGRRASRLPWAFIYRAVGAHVRTFEANPGPIVDGIISTEPITKSNCSTVAAGGGTRPLKVQAARDISSLFCSNPSYYFKA